MIVGMTASESHRSPHPISGFPLGSLAWPDAAEASALRAGQGAGQGFVAVLLDGRHLPTLPPPLSSEVIASHRHADPEGFLARRRAIRALVGNFLDTRPETLVVGQTQWGAPIVENSDVWISLSGRPPLSAVALAKRPVGIDIERIIAAEDIPWNILRHDERETLLALPKPRQGEAFTCLWAAKEAYAKALGQGFLLPPEALVIAPGGVAQCRPLLGQPGLPPGLVAVNRHEPPGGKTVIIALALLSS